MEVPGGPHYPLLIIKGEHRGYAALTKRVSWLLALCLLRSRIDRNDHYVLVHWCPSLSPCAPNRIIKAGSVIPRLLDSTQKIPCKYSKGMGCDPGDRFHLIIL